MVDPSSTPYHDIRYGITDEDALAFLEELATEDSELRSRLQENPRETLLEHGIDIVGIPETVELPPAQQIADFIETYLRGERKTHNVGYAILYWMLGAMPLVVADSDAAP